MLCEFCGQQFDDGRKLGGHKANCKLNPKFEARHLKLVEKSKIRRHSDVVKSKISLKSIESYANGRKISVGIGRPKWEYSSKRFPYTKLNGNAATYIVDFTVYLNSSTFYLIEVKGPIVANDLLKWRAVINSGFKLEIFRLQDIVDLEQRLGLLAQSG